MSEAPPPKNWSFELPEQLRLALAGAITLFARIDHRIIETLWVIEDADLARKKKIAKAVAHDNITTIRAFIEQIPGAETDKIWPELERLRNERNLMAHGIWAITDDGRPLVVWHSKFLESDDYIGAEYFDFSRFSRFMKSGARLFDTFTKFQVLMERAAETQAR